MIRCETSKGARPAEKSPPLIGGVVEARHCGVFTKAVARNQDSALMRSFCVSCLAEHREVRLQGQLGAGGL